MITFIAKWEKWCPDNMAPAASRHIVQTGPTSTLLMAVYKNRGNRANGRCAGTIIFQRCCSSCAWYDRVWWWSFGLCLGFENSGKRKFSLLDCINERLHSGMRLSAQSLSISRRTRSSSKFRVALVNLEMHAKAETSYHARSCENSSSIPDLIVPLKKTYLINIFALLHSLNFPVAGAYSFTCP